MPAQLELGVDQLLARRCPQLLESRDLDARERLEREVGERRPAPEAERLAQELRAPLGVSALGRLRHEPLEAVQIDLLGLDVQHVARLPSAHEIAAERLAQVRDQVLERPDRRLRRLPRPQLLDQAVCRDDLACMEQQQRQEGALLSASSARAHVPPPRPRTGPGRGTRSCCTCAVLPLSRGCHRGVTAREPRVRGPQHPRCMHEPQGTGLIGEAERYLAAVAVFRAEGSEPRWQLEHARRRRRPTTRPLDGARTRTQLDRRGR